MRRLILAVVGIFCFSGGAFAQQRVGNWVVDISGGYTEAYTGNDSGSIFGLYCVEACDFYLNTRTRCEEKVKTPLLINADSGSTYVMSSCIHI